MLHIPCMPATGLQAAARLEQRQCSDRPCGGQNLPSDFNLARARQNYLAVARGLKSPSQLSLAEAQEIRELLKLLEQNRKANGSAYERCRDLELGGRSDPTELELRLIDLKCSMR